MNKNGTPYSDEAWKKWYAHKSNKELWIEHQEANEIAIDEAIEARFHHHDD